MVSNDCSSSALSIQILAERIWQMHPRVHCYAPSVSASDTANLLLACGASPILSDNPYEAAEITEKSQALSLSLGMPSLSRKEAMLKSGQAAKNRGIPVVLDLTGIGVSAFRKEMAHTLIDKVHPDVIKGNVSELGCLCGYGTNGSIDADLEEYSSLLENERFLSCLQAYARAQYTILVCTGQRDLVVSAKGGVYEVSGGSIWMSRISGTGCMLTAVLAAALAAGGKERLEAVCLTLQMFKDWGAWAAKVMKSEEGPGSFHMHFLDAPYCMLPDSGRED